MRMLYGSALLVAISCVAACGRTPLEKGGVYCVASATIVPAIEVTVIDGKTNTVATTGASGTLKSQNGKTTPLVATGNPIVLTGGSSGGTYTVTVSKAGVSDWTQTVAVTADECSPKTLRLAAWMY